MTVHDDDQAKRTERAREVGLFRYALVRAAADPALSPRQRGALVRELAAAEHVGPFGQPVVVGRSTLDRWVRAWRAGGFDALVPPVRHVQPRTQAQVLDLSAALKRERPERTAAQVRRVVVAHLGWAPSERTLQRLFVRLELNTRPDGRTPQAFGRFEADHPNDRWLSDALCRILIWGGPRAYATAVAVPICPVPLLSRTGYPGLSVGVRDSRLPAT